MNNASNRILVFNLNWLGDILFSLPSLEAIKSHTPNSHLACIVPPPYQDLLENQKFIDEVIAVSDRTLWGKYRLLQRLKQKKWDIGFLFHRSQTRARLFKWAHVQERIGYAINRSHLLTHPIALSSQPQHKMDRIRSLLLSYGISPVKETYEYHPPEHTSTSLPTPYIVFHPGSNWPPKRWPIHHFAQLGNELFNRYGVTLVITGTSDDKILAHRLKSLLHPSSIDLTGKTSLTKLSCIFQRACLVIAGDTGPMHLATASGAKVIALYGPTSPLLNGPRGHDNFKVIWENPGCKTYPCYDKRCLHDSILERLSPQKVLSVIKEWKIFEKQQNLSIFVGDKAAAERKSEAYLKYVEDLSEARTPYPAKSERFLQKILLVRTDRIGDVMLTTPIIKTIHDHFPKSHIAFLTGPQTQELVQGNPFLDEVIIYDKHNRHRSILKTILFARKLRRKKFDIALVFNPSKRTHWITFLAKIAQRIGYNKKSGWLLTHALEDKKWEGLKSESFYNEDLLFSLKILPPHSQALYFPLMQESDAIIDQLLKAHHIDGKFVVINVSTGGDPSRKWPLQNFAKLSQLLHQKLNLKIVLIGQQKECATVQTLVNIPFTILAESLSLKELGVLLKKSFLHITNDTGTKYIAAALGTSVFTIFGRSLPGVSPKRWAPLGKNHLYFHKDIGCNPCLPHACPLDLDCLKTIKPEEIFYAIQNRT